jgi:hypothetical protein
MTQLPLDSDVAKDYVDRYYRSLNGLEEKLRELAIDKKSFDNLFSEALTQHRLAISAENLWIDALQADFDRLRAKASRRPLRRLRQAR